MPFSKILERIILICLFSYGFRILYISIGTGKIKIKDFNFTPTISKNQRFFDIELYLFQYINYLG